MSEKNETIDLEKEAILAINPFKKVYPKQLIWTGYLICIGLILFAGYLIFDILVSLNWALNSPFMTITNIFLVLEIIVFLFAAKKILEINFWARGVHLMNDNVDKAICSTYSEKGFYDKQDHFIPFQNIYRAIESKNLFVFYQRDRSNTKPDIRIYVCPKNPDINFDTIAHQYSIKTVKGFHQESI